MLDQQHYSMCVFPVDVLIRVGHTSCCLQSASSTHIHTHTHNTHMHTHTTHTCTCTHIHMHTHPHAHTHSMDLWTQLWRNWSKEDLDLKNGMRSGLFPIRSVSDQVWFRSGLVPIRSGSDQVCFRSDLFPIRSGSDLIRSVHDQVCFRSGLFPIRSVSDQVWFRSDQVCFQSGLFLIWSGLFTIRSVFSQKECHQTQRIRIKGMMWLQLYWDGLNTHQLVEILDNPKHLHL